MFRSWKSAPPKALDQEGPSSRQRSIPIPLKDYDSDSNFKNPSEPESSEPTMPAPEFSRVRSAMSIHTLRRFVRTPESAGGASDDNGDSQLAGKPEEAKSHGASDPRDAPSRLDASKNDSASREKAGKQADKQVSDSTGGGAAGGGTAGETRADDGWIWSMFKTDKRPQLNESNSVKSKGSAWAFWARQSSPAGSDVKESGTLAVSGTETEHNPRRAELDMPKTKRRKTTRPSLVVPEFASIPWPSAASRLSNLFWSSVSSNSYRHLVLQNAVKPKRAVIIGVHGYFPAKVTRAILGEPTGTSIKFANEAEQRLQHWFTERYPNDSIHIDKIALEGEGKIEHRVDKLYDLLLNWNDLLKRADFIFFAVHSQGAVVTVNIVARLLEQNLLSKKQRIAILSMAGSMLGPMPGMDKTLIMKAITRIEHDSLIELFQLQDVESKLSRALRTSLTTVLAAGIKVILVGSADDQLIPLYSALGVNVHHPNLFRSVYIDGDDVVHDVVAPLLQLAAQQLNWGGTDHGVINELSGVLAGSFTSKGHSKLYNNGNVYDLGLRIALETAPSTRVPPRFDTDFKIHGSTSNPFLLPWAANALVSDSRKSSNFKPTVNELLLQFNAWKPETKQMKDLKLRLAGIGRISKL